MHLLMKPETDAVYSSIPSEEPRNMSVQAKHSCSLASASFDHLFIDQVTGASCFKMLLVSRNQEDRVMARFAKWRARESFVCVSVCGAKVI